MTNPDQTVQLRLMLDRMSVSMVSCVHDAISPEMVKELVEEAINNFDFKKAVGELLQREIHWAVEQRVRDRLRAESQRIERITEELVDDLAVSYKRKLKERL